MKFINICLFFTVLSLCLPAFASEDSPSPFPEGYMISDLPDLPELDNLENIDNIDNSAKTEIDYNALNTTTDVNDNVLPPPPSDTTLTFEQSLIDNNPVIPTVNMDIPNGAAESEEPQPIFQETSNSEETNNGLPHISTDQSLTETLKQGNDSSFIDGTWVEKLTTINPMSVFSSSENTEPASSESSLVDLIKSSRNKRKEGKSNASVFDISGVMLKMTLNQVERTLANRGFKKINAEYAIPNFIKWRNEENCRVQGIVGYDRMQACIKTLSRKDGHEYVFHVKYAKFDSKEEIDVYFTSNFTENKVHKIEYRSKIAAITGNSPKAIYIRNLKVYDFWKKINQKFGNPDNKKNVTWGLGGNKPFLKASTGYLLLDDPMFREMDYTRMSREDKRFIHSDYYNF